MRALKILVVVLGVFLALGTVALVVAIVYRVQHGPLLARTPARHVGPARVVVDLPAGAHIESTEVTGDRIVVRVTLPEGGEDLVLFDARSGKQLSTIELRPAAPRADSRP